jgi:hypothetical protein
MSVPQLSETLLWKQNNIKRFMEAREEDEWFFIKGKDLTPIKFLSLQNHQILKESFLNVLGFAPLQKTKYILVFTLVVPLKIEL